MAARARRRRRGGDRPRAGARGPRDGRCAGRGVRLAAGWAGRVGAERRALAGRVARALPERGGAGRAAGRDRPAAPAPAAARARGARIGDARRAPRGDADEPARRAARGQPAGRAAGRAAGRRGHRAPARGPHPGGGARRAGSKLAHEQAAPQRDRLGPHHPRQPQALPARPAHGHPRTARRPRPKTTIARGRADPVPRPEREHGVLGRPRRRARRRRSPRCRRCRPA